MNKEKKVEYPKCPDCGKAMVWTFSFPHKEYACLPCNRTVPMFNSLEKILRYPWCKDAANPDYKFEYWKTKIKIKKQKI